MIATESAATNDDKAGIEYWNGVWGDDSLPKPIDPSNPSLRSFVYRRFHQFFAALFSKRDTRNMSLLEIGCARSAWLPYFHKQFGASVSGLDYSERGCEQERHLLALAGVAGEVVCSDLFDAPTAFRQRFDVVVTFGVVEHFEDTARCIAALSEYLKPGGIVITEVPNMGGMIGTLQKALNRPVYDIHVLLTPDTLREAHLKAGLTPTRSEYFLSTNFGVINLNGLDGALAITQLKKITLLALRAASMAAWLLEDLGLPFPTSALLSPYVICVAEKR